MPPTTKPKSPKAPTTRINREEFLRKMEEVKPGLSAREIIDQSSCVIFRKGIMRTFNEEIACRTASGLPEEFTAAVKAGPLQAMLMKLVEDELEVSFDESHLILKGINRRAGIRMEAEILLPVESIDKERPEDWQPLHNDFTDAISIVQECAGKDENRFDFTCVHIHPAWIEACDNYQMTRYPMKTGVKERFLLRKESIKHVPGFDLTKFCVTDSWIHFRGPSKFIMSIRKYTDEYPDISAELKVKGSPVTLPAALGEAVDKASVFSSESGDDNLILVELRPGLLRIKGEGASGYYTELKKVKYAGKPLGFRVAPKLLAELVKRHTDCEVTTDQKIKVDGGKFTYVACLEPPETIKEEEEERGDE